MTASLEWRRGGRSTPPLQPGPEAAKYVVFVLRKYMVQDRMEIRLIKTGYPLRTFLGSNVLLEAHLFRLRLLSRLGDDGQFLVGIVHGPECHLLVKDFPILRQFSDRECSSDEARRRPAD